MPIADPLPANPGTATGAPAFTLLHADEALLVLDKPAGLLAVPGRGEAKQDALSARVQQHYPDALIVHRLDMATSGLLLMARGLHAQRLLSRAFAAREVHKRYVAVVAGRLGPKAATSDGWSVIDLPIGADWPNRPLQKIDPVQGKPSTTRWRVLAHDAARHASRLELEPITGRSHQLRVHLQAIGHPILGDALYSPPVVLAQSPRLLLHATVLAFSHPVTGVQLRFESQPPF
jgi:tRNA pseudouridine32 synthase / 23S rRNA pseudouridine746 synthase